MDFADNRKFERKFTKMIKRILGSHFIIQDIEEDMYRGTDFLVLTVEPFRVAVRLRRFPKKYQKYKGEFTIRWSLPSGARTEIDKVNDCLVDYLLYGFVDPAETRIISYFLGDLTIFRKYRPPARVYQNKPRPNKRPDSKLAVFRLSELPDSFIKAHWSVGAAEITECLIRREKMNHGFIADDSNAAEKMPALRQDA